MAGYTPVSSSLSKDKGEIEMKNHIEINGDVATIFVESKRHGKYEVKISTSKLDIVNKIEGKCHIQKILRTGHTYAMVNHPEKKKAIALHRLIMGDPKDMHIDHINHDTLDNTDENLRIVTHAENQQNKKLQKNNKSGVRGVHWVKRKKKWCALIQINNKSYQIGYFHDLAEAERAVVNARKRAMPFAVESA